MLGLFCHNVTLLSHSSKRSCWLETPSDSHDDAHSQDCFGDLFQLFGIHKLVILHQKLVCTNPSEINNVDQSIFIQKVDNLCLLNVFLRCAWCAEGGDAVASCMNTKNHAS